MIAVVPFYNKAQEWFKWTYKWNGCSPHEEGRMIAVVPVYDRAHEWFKWCNLSMEVMSPCLRAVKYEFLASEVLDKLATRVNMGISAYVKSHVFQKYYTPDKSSILIVDADTLFLGPFDWAPERADTVIAMAPGGDPRYLNWLCEFGLLEIPEDLATVFNCGVIWLNTDVAELWEKYYPSLAAMIENPMVSIGEVTWNAFWYHFHREGKAEILPQRFNQLYGQQGIGGASILHFAGMHPRFKTSLIENTFNFFYEETEQRGIWRPRESL